MIAAFLVLASLALAGPETTNVFISILTLLMVFVLQNTQNRDSAAIHLKLDEIVKVETGARNDIRGSEVMPEPELEELSLTASRDDWPS